MRSSLIVYLGILLASIQLLGEVQLSQNQIDVLLNRYEEGIKEGRFRYREGKGQLELRAYLRQGAISRIRHEVLEPVHQALPAPAPSPVSQPVVSKISQPTPGPTPQSGSQANYVPPPKLSGNDWGEGGFEQKASEGWGSSSGWSDSPAKGTSEVDSWIRKIAEASQDCNYAEAKRLADLVMAKDPGNSWIASNYKQIKEWAEKSAVYFEALNAAYAALEREDFDSTVAQLRVALINAASNCGQDVMVQSLLNQSIQASNDERDAAIARARAEGAIHQQTFSQIQAAREAEKAKREENKGGLTRGFMSILGTAAKIGVLKETGNMSSEDAITQVLQQEVLNANPDLGELVNQAQQIDSLAQGGNTTDILQSFQQQQVQSNPELAQALATLQQIGQTGGYNPGQNPSIPNQVNRPTTTSYPPTGFGTTVSNGTPPSFDQMSPVCQKIYKELEKIGKEMEVHSEAMMAFQKNPNVSTSQIQSTAAQVMMLNDKAQALIKKLKENNCPGADQIPDYPTF